MKRSGLEFWLDEILGCKCGRLAKFFAGERDGPSAVGFKRHFIKLPIGRLPHKTLRHYRM